MKIPNVLTICIVFCCLFAGNIFAVPEGCIEVTKDADCAYSAVGGTINYTITIENCGDVELGEIYVEDSLLGPLNLECDVLSPDESCTIEYPYNVPPTPEPVLLNTVTVTAAAEPTFDGVATFNGGFEVTASASATVELVNPDFTLDVECINEPDGIVNGNGGTALFSVCLSNIGDVDLDIQVDCLMLPPITLDSDGTVCYYVRVPLDGVGPCGTGGIATLECTATATIPPDYCVSPNELVRTDADTCEILPCEPSFTVQKTCLTSPAGGDCALQPGDLASYEIVITNTSICEDPGQPLDLFFLVNDPAAGIENLEVGPIPAGGGTWMETVRATVPDCPSYQTECVDLASTVFVEGFCALTGESVGVDEASGVCEFSCRPPEGCTPGFWKNHPNCWCDPFRPDTLVSDVWTALQGPPYDTIDDGDRKSDFDTDSLADALRYRGGRGLAGSARNMLRHATAALLNACSSDVGYPVSDAAVIDLGNYVLESGDPAMIQDLHALLSSWNEEFPCPIDAHCRRIDDEVNGD
jgi:uncharacterized repeat protein (TIGR01451 family)